MNNSLYLGGADKKDVSLNKCYRSEIQRNALGCRQQKNNNKPNCEIRPPPCNTRILLNMMDFDLTHFFPLTLAQVA